MKRKTINAWKVVRMIHGERRSAFAYGSVAGRIYIPGERVFALSTLAALGYGLAVFDTLQAASKFTWNLVDDWELWEVSATVLENPATRIVFATPVDIANNVAATYVRNATYGGWPEHTVICRSLVLKKRVSHSLQNRIA